MSEAIKIGDKVQASFPDGWTLGGHVIMVIQERDKPPQYDVQFFDNSHLLFPASNVKLFS